MEYKVTEFFSNTKETIERKADAAEIADIKAREKKVLEIQSELETKAAQRLAIAERLGLTADELQVLLG